MEQIILILILFILINSSLKMSFWSWWLAAIFGLFCAGFILWAQQYAIEQSKTQLTDYLTNNTVLQDMAVLISVESGIGFAFCFTALRKVFGKKPTRFERFLYFYPTLLIFPVLFYLLTQANFKFTGVGFETISYLMAAGVFLLLPLLSYFFRYFIHEKELRLELLFLVNLFVSILGLITTVNGNVVYRATEEDLDPKAILVSLAIFAVAFLGGYLLSKLKWMLASKKRIKESSQIS